MNTNFSRRNFIMGSVVGTSALYLGGCSFGSTRYDEANAELRRISQDSSIRDLVRYATLAANGHNTQPWKFKISTNTIAIIPDFSRRTPVVDPDDHHLYASLGCAAENLTLAAQAQGQSGQVDFDRSGEGRLVVDLSSTRLQQSTLFEAIIERQCTRASYDGRIVSSEIIDRLQRAANTYGVEAYVITDEEKTENILSLVVEGNSRQMDDPEFVRELKEWLRFNGTSAAETGDGLYAASSGNPTSPDWLGSRLFSLFFNKDKENDKYADHIRSSAGLIVFVARSDDKEGWINAGRAYERFALQSTVDGLKHAFVNQAVEDLHARQALQSLLGIGDRRPNLVVRFGYGPEMPKSLRRPVDSVIL